MNRTAIRCTSLLLLSASALPLTLNAQVNPDTPPNVDFLQCEESCVNRFGLSMAQARVADVVTREGEISFNCLMQCSQQANDHAKQIWEQWFNSLPPERQIQVLQQKKALEDAHSRAVDRHNAWCEQQFNADKAGGTSGLDAALSYRRCLQY